MKQYLRKIPELLAGVAVVCLLCWVGFTEYWVYSRPRMPQPELGRVLPVNDHGTVVYATRQEEVLRIGLRWGGLSLFACAVALEAVLRARSKKHGERWRK